MDYAHTYIQVTELCLKCNECTDTRSFLLIVTDSSSNMPVGELILTVCVKPFEPCHTFTLEVAELHSNRLFNEIVF